MRDCAWRALVALARKRSMKACRCSRFRLLALLRLLVEHQAFAADAVELAEAAAVERELALVEVQDEVDRRVEQVAVVARDQHGVWIVPEIILHPQRAFEIEEVGGLVE